MCCTPFFCLIYYHVKGMAAGLDVAKIHAEVRPWNLLFQISIDFASICLVAPL